jgi:hypothetical protein
MSWLLLRSLPMPMRKFVGRPSLRATSAAELAPLDPPLPPVPVVVELELVLEVEDVLVEEVTLDPPLPVEALVPVAIVPPDPSTPAESLFEQAASGPIDISAATVAPRPRNPNFRRECMTHILPLSSVAAEAPDSLAVVRPPALGHRDVTSAKLTRAI